MRQCSTPCWQRRTGIGVDERYARNFMRWEIRWKINSYIHQFEPLSYRCFCCFLISLCCPPSPPCRAALHAGACWPWRPTRYCQPTFHTPFCCLKIFLLKDVHPAWKFTSFLYLHVSVALHFSHFADKFQDNLRLWIF